MALRVEIVTPTKIAFTGEADQVQAPGQLGEFGVLPKHELMVALTQPGIVTQHTGGSQQAFKVGTGFAEVGGDHVTLLVDSCEATSVH